MERPPEPPATRAPDIRNPSARYPKWVRAMLGFGLVNGSFAGYVVGLDPSKLVDPVVGETDPTSFDER